MRIVKPGEKLTHKELRYFAKMAGQAYVNDPVHTYATKDPAAREKFVSHFMMERLHTSNGEDWFFIDDENRGLCVWRKARNEYGFFDFMLCADWVYLFAFLPRTVRTLAAYSPLDVKMFDEDTWIISPVFVAPEHQGQGIATELIKKSMETLAPLGYRFGLEAQDERNVRFYERLGFRTVQEAYYQRGDIRHYYMVYQDESQNGEGHGLPHRDPGDQVRHIQDRRRPDAMK
ncbi:MAG: GNAT family N-acetyltransferase [Clostridia bacterium]|nr:GNAT family N-acetyltransferase [Clostridia bacterium]